MQFFVSQFLVVNFLINLYMYFQHLVSQFWIEFGSVGANKRAVAIHPIIKVGLEKLGKAD